MKRIKIWLRKLALKKHNIVIGKRTNISLDSRLGDYSYIGNNCDLTKAVIGRYCSLANNVTIGAGEHLPSEISTSSLFYLDAYEILTNKNCIIGNDVWIGVNSVVRRGVTIGDGAIIGANSFVNKDIPAFSIAVGSPAKVIRSRFSEEQKELILSSRWWERDLSEAHKELLKLKSLIKSGRKHDI